MLWQPALPDRYHAMSDDELIAAIDARKAELGDRLVILGHHYQQDDVIRFADFTGDSFKLSQLAAERVEEVGAKYVVFAGVHFMAESADILTPDDVTVILPDLGAGCSMADMADHDEATHAWEMIAKALGTEGSSHRATEGVDGESSSMARSLDGSVASCRVIPICYMNCSAAIKSFVGRHGGAVCTSSNCEAVFDWALAGGTKPKAEGEQIKILFLPDQHLGRNTAAAMGYDPVTQMCLWDPKSNDLVGMGGLDSDDIRRSTFILWKGHCSVHKLFRAEHVDQVRADWPDVTVMVHPECAYEVVQKADRVGSTEGIRKAVEEAESGSRWAIGTEVHMVNRLANEAKARDVEVRILSDCQCLCTTMYRIDLPHLLWTLDKLAEGEAVNVIKVDDETRKWALVALDRMLELVGSGTLRKSDAPSRV